MRYHVHVHFSSSKSLLKVIDEVHRTVKQLIKEKYINAGISSTRQCLAHHEQEEGNLRELEYRQANPSILESNQ